MGHEGHVLEHVLRGMYREAHVLCGRMLKGGCEGM